MGLLNRIINDNQGLGLNKWDQRKFKDLDFSGSNVETTTNMRTYDDPALAGLGFRDGKTWSIDRYGKWSLNKNLTDQQINALRKRGFYYDKRGNYYKNADALNKAQGQQMINAGYRWKTVDGKQFRINGNVVQVKTKDGYKLARGDAWNQWFADRNLDARLNPLGGEVVISKKREKVGPQYTTKGGTNTSRSNYTWNGPGTVEDYQNWLTSKGLGSELGKFGADGKYGNLTDISYQKHKNEYLQDRYNNLQTQQDQELTNYDNQNKNVQQFQDAALKTDNGFRIGGGSYGNYGRSYKNARDSYWYNRKYNHWDKDTAYQDAMQQMINQHGSDLINENGEFDLNKARTIAGRYGFNNRRFNRYWNSEAVGNMRNTFLANNYTNNNGTYARNQVETEDWKKYQQGRNDLIAKQNQQDNEFNTKYGTQPDITQNTTTPTINTSNTPPTDWVAKAKGVNTNLNLNLPNPILDQTPKNDITYNHTGITDPNNKHLFSRQGGKIFFHLNGGRLIPKHGLGSFIVKLLGKNVGKAEKEVTAAKELLAKLPKSEQEAIQKAMAENRTTIDAVIQRLNKGRNGKPLKGSEAVAKKNSIERKYQTKYGKQYQEAFNKNSEIVNNAEKLLQDAKSARNSARWKTAGVLGGLGLGYNWMFGGTPASAAEQQTTQETEPSENDLQTLIDQINAENQAAQEQYQQWAEQQQALNAANQAVQQAPTQAPVTQQTVTQQPVVQPTVQQPNIPVVTETTPVVSPKVFDYTHFYDGGRTGMLNRQRAAQSMNPIYFKDPLTNQVVQFDANLHTKDYFKHIANQMKSGYGYQPPMQPEIKLADNGYTVIS